MYLLMRTYRYFPDAVFQLGRGLHQFLGLGHVAFLSQRPHGCPRCCDVPSCVGDKRQRRHTVYHYKSYKVTMICIDSGPNALSCKVTCDVYRRLSRRPK